MPSRIAHQKMREMAREVAQEMKNATGSTVDVEDLVSTAHAAFILYFPIEWQQPENYMRFELYLTIARIALVGGITDNPDYQA
jgi:hypothetical protein